MALSDRLLNVSDSSGVPQGSEGRGGAAVLFVCLGNICRSPLAEGMLVHLLEQEGMAERVRVDSAGTGAWHAGEPPDARSAEVARRHGVALRGAARQVRPEDFREFTHVIAMDLENLKNLEQLRNRSGGDAVLGLLREWDPEGGEGAEVPDPYYGGPDGFETVYRMVERSCAALVAELKENPGDGGGSRAG